MKLILSIAVGASSYFFYLFSVFPDFKPSKVGLYKWANGLNACLSAVLFYCFGQYVFNKGDWRPELEVAGVLISIVAEIGLFFSLFWILEKTIDKMGAAITEKTLRRKRPNGRRVNPSPLRLSRRLRVSHSPRARHR
jgi:hypothetical protein